MGIVVTSLDKNNTNDFLYYIYIHIYIHLCILYSLSTFKPRPDLTPSLEIIHLQSLYDTNILKIFKNLTYSDYVNICQSKCMMHFL